MSWSYRRTPRCARKAFQKRAALLLLGLLVPACGEGLLRGGQRADRGLADQRLGAADAGPGAELGPRPDAQGADRGALPADRGLAPDLGPDAFAGRPVVWIVGDSLAVGAGDPAHSLMDSKYDVVVRGVVGAPISYAKTEVLNAMAAGADAIVVQSGINDVGGGTANVSQLTQSIGGTLDATTGVRCAFWVTYQTIYTQGYLALNNSAPTLNQVIRAEVAKRGAWAEVIDFQPHIDAHPELNAPDGLHLTTAGYRELAKFYRDALAPCFGF